MRDAPAADTAGLDAAARLIATRRSVRRYASAPVDPALVDRLLACATAAPSAHNRQPWRFAVLHDAESRTRLARAMGERLRADRLADGDEAATVDADVARSYARIADTPVVIVVALTMADMDVYPDARRRDAERTMAVQGTAMAVQNLLIAAHAANLGACWMCAPLFCPEVVREALALPADWEPQALVTLGVPASAAQPRSRKPQGEVVRRGGRS
jgi:F420 biosynthesis protein FbiB-like protein